MKKNFFVVAAFIISSQLIAQSDTTVKSLDEVVITANKFEQKQILPEKSLRLLPKNN